MLALGVDPGHAICGFGFVNSKLQPLDFGVITTNPKARLQDRLLKIFSELDSLIKKYKPDVLGVEKLFFGRNTTTALAVAHARGIILLAAAINNLNTFEISPNEVKCAVTGYGHANKAQVTFMVTNILKLKQPPRPDDAADALAVAISTLNSRGSYL